MRRSYGHILVFVGLLLLFVGASLAVAGGTARSAGYGSPMVLDNHVNPLFQHAQLLQALPADQQLNISVGLQTRNTTEFDSLLQSIYDPQSSSYHHYLTPDQFMQSFAPTSDQVQQVKNYLQGQGMSVTNVAADNLLLDVKTTASQAQKAFGMQMNTYKMGASTFYANASPVMVPSSIRPLITSVVGLDSSVKLHPHNASAKTTLKSSPAGYTPKDIANAYDMAPLQSSGFQGDNQTIALVALDGYQLSDITHYVQNFNPGSTVSNLSNVLVDGYNGAAGQNASETTLDIEIAEAVAPHANILVYEGANTTLSVASDIYAKIVSDNKAQIVSASWGLCEVDTGAAEMQVFDTIFKQGAAQGISFFAGSGDGGAYDCGDNNLAVDYPASDPYVTGVGGTSLQLNGDGTTKSESVWSNASDQSSYMLGDGSGGGISTTYTKPSWQKGNGVTNSYSNGHREVPDVSANADLASGYAIYCTVPNTGFNGWGTAGGTSAASPLWAGSTALINQYMKAQAKKQVGLINPALYGLFNGTQTYPAFHDITTGTNLFYPATSGYDLATGLGSPNVFNIARDLVINAGGTIPTATPTPSPTPTSTNTALAQDNFQRTNQVYWSTASDGQVWGGDANTSNNFSINNNTGQVANGSGSFSAVLGATATNAQVVFSGSVNNYIGNNIGAVLRWNDGNNWYKAYLDGASLIVQKKVNGNTTVLSAAVFIVLPNTSYTLRFSIVGSTLSAKAWATSDAEPSGWMVTTTDSTFQSGYCGLRMQVLGNSTATFTSFQATAA